MNYDFEKYPMIWNRKSTKGYCFTARIPCRVLEMRGSRVRIAALLVDGRERNHLVEETSLQHDPCHCFAECRALEKFKGKIVKEHPEPEAHAALETGSHKYMGCESAMKGGQFFTSDCSYGCGCWMGSSRSGGPKGVDPFGACPKAPAEVKG